MVIERYKGNIASSVATLEGKIIIAKKRYFAICVIIGKPSLIISTNGYTSKCKAIQKLMV